MNVGAAPGLGQGAALALGRHVGAERPRRFPKGLSILHEGLDGKPQKAVRHRLLVQFQTVCLDWP